MCQLTQMWMFEKAARAAEEGRSVPPRQRQYGIRQPSCVYQMCINSTAHT